MQFNTIKWKKICVSNVVLFSNIPISRTDKCTMSVCLYTNTNLYVVGCYDKNIYFIDLISGMIKLKHTTEDIIKSSPMIEGDMVYCGSHDYVVYCFNMVRYLHISGTKTIIL